MTPQDVIALIGRALQVIDNLLDSPDLLDSDPEWQTLYSLRKAINDQQRGMVAAEFQQNTAGYAQITQKLQVAGKQLQTTIADIEKIADTIATVNQIVGYIGQLLQLAA